MDRAKTTTCCVAVCLCLLAADSKSGESHPQPLPQQDAHTPPTPTPLEDDATLHDVQFVGPATGWAVGDHGVAWNTRDGGRTWQFVKTPVDCPLRSVCFLTDRVGWIVGGGTVPHTRLGYGVVLSTTDGGTTWTLLARDQLPPLAHVQFFDLETGVAVGDVSAGHPTGVMRTNDGGQTWEPIDGRRHPGWRAAAFARSRIGTEIGVAVGLRGRISMVGREKMLPARLESLGPATLRDVTLEPDETGWLVGDAALLLRTTNRGLVWQDPPTLLPSGLRDIANFYAVASWKKKVWVAGQPGSVVWHSPDGGRTWVKQFTREPAPIHALAFCSESTGCAVGALGMILHTSDGGRTWTPVRGSGRRVALLAAHARPGRVSFPLLAKQSGDLGYRSAVLLPVRNDIDPDGFEELDLELRLHDAVTAAGGSAALVDWRFPISRPELDLNPQKLLELWNRQTEGRLTEVLLGQFVGLLRTWRPSVLVLDEPPQDDAVSHLMNDALITAVKRAGDPTFFIDHSELAGLDSWLVSRVYVRLPDGSTGQTYVDLYEYLPRLKMTVQMAAAAAAGRMAASVPARQREAYALRLDSSIDGRPQPAAGDFFATIGLPPGSDARRQVRLDLQVDETVEALIRRQRNFQAAADEFLDNDQFAAQLIGQLRQVSAGMPDEQAALVLSQLADGYARRSQWDLAESTLVELIHRYPHQPVSLDAMRWLFQYWVGMEPAWQRARKTNVSSQSLAVDRASIREAIQQAVHLTQIHPDSRDSQQDQIDPDPVTILERQGQLRIGENDSWRRGAVRHWHEQALRLASIMRKRSPALYRSPEIQFPMSSLMRQTGLSARLGRAFQHRQAAGSDDPWAQTAEAELWLTNPLDVPNKKIVKCHETGERPYLDAMLSDACWQSAEEIRLTAADQETQPEADPGGYAFAMLSYDSEYLYFAASVPRAAGVSDDRPLGAGRTHDADLSGFDRLGLFIDIDRDYATYYSLEVDQRGWTTDACWNDVAWNPRWHVAAAGDDERWRIEAAIPLEELVPAGPSPGSVWAVGIVRTIPTIGFESWTHPAASQPRPQTFGLVRFD